MRYLRCASYESFHLSAAVANLPAEIQHHLEEIQAKDQVVQECRNTINSHDRSLQKFIKMNGSNVKNPKEEPYGKIILQNYKQAKTIQEEKVALAEKAAMLVRFPFGMAVVD